MGLRYTAQGRQWLLGCIKSHLQVVQGLHHPGGLLQGNRGVGLWPQSSQQRNPMVPGGKAAASAPLVAISLFGSVSLGISSCKGVRAELQRGRTSSWGSHGNSFPVLVSSWALCPGGGGCIVPKTSFFPICFLQQPLSNGFTGRIQTCQDDASPWQRGWRLPLTSLFLMGLPLG